MIRKFIFKQILNFKLNTAFFSSSLAITNGVIVNADRTFKGDIFIENHIIKKIVK